MFHILKDVESTDEGSGWEASKIKCYSNKLEPWGVDAVEAPLLKDESGFSFLPKGDESLDFYIDIRFCGDTNLKAMVIIIIIMLPNLNPNQVLQEPIEN